LRVIRFGRLCTIYRCRSWSKFTLLDKPEPSSIALGNQPG
jgi:hypothetical protein